MGRIWFLNFQLSNSHYCLISILCSKRKGDHTTTTATHEATNQQYDSQTFANTSNEDNTIDQHTNSWDTNDLILHQFSLDSKILTHFWPNPYHIPPLFFRQQWLQYTNHKRTQTRCNKPTNSKWSPHMLEGNYTRRGPHPQANKQAINKQTTPYTSRLTMPSILCKYEISN